MIDRLRRHPAVLLGGLIVVPLALTAILLLGRPWVPVLDMAMTELRVRDVGGRHTPLIGLPGRIGEFPDQGSHPGPWSFYLVAPIYRLAGATAWGMELASIVINGACVGAIVALGHRRFGWPGAATFGLLAAIAVRGYGLTVLTHPWNPYFPVLLWLLALLAAWLTIDGDHWLAVVVVVTTVVAAQTHVPYLASAVAIDALVVGALVLAIARARRDGGRGPVAPLITMVAAGAVLWLPAVVEQVRRPDGNVSKLVRHFATDPPEEPIGLVAAARLVTQHFDAVRIAVGLIIRDDALVHRAGQDRGASLIGGAVLLAWLASAGWAWRRRHRTLLALHAVVAVATAAGLLSISRIFGKLWFYLTLWMSSAVLLAVASIAWTAWIVLRERRDPVARAATRARVAAASAALVGVVTLASVTAAAGHQVPERNLAEDLRVIVPEVTAALDAGTGAAVGRDGSYVVFWQESIAPGAQGYALLNELEREGYRVGVHPTWRVPATPHRVRVAGEYDAEVHLVSGGFVDEWRTKPDHVEVFAYDGRTGVERQRFEELERRAVSRLAEIGRDEVIPIVGENVFRASLMPGLPDDVVSDLGEMLQIGEPVAIFVAPAGSTF